MAIAYAILNDIDYETALRAFGTQEMNLGVDEYGRSRFGSGFMKWLKNESEGKSNGNGASMRISPVGYYFDQLETALQEAKKQHKHHMIQKKL